MGPIWDRRDAGGPHVGPTNLAIWAYILIVITMGLGKLVVTKYSPHPVLIFHLAADILIVIIWQLLIRTKLISSSKLLGVDHSLMTSEIRHSRHINSIHRWSLICTVVPETYRPCWFRRNGDTSTSTTSTTTLSIEKTAAKAQDPVHVSPSNRLKSQRFPKEWYI